ncbi:MAG: asparaginase [Firmicutes bacterium]|nr:asparaginase [Bacillota bacterium]
MKVLIIATGGTISQIANEDGILESNETSRSGSDFMRILESKKETLGIESISAKTIMNKDSANMVMEDWQCIVRAVVDNYDHYDAFIVTHGTETMGYASSAVSFALGRLGKPVAFTGAQSSFGAPGSDSIMNLENTLRVLSLRRDLVGVFLVFGTNIVSGTRVKKKTEFDYDAFKCSRRFRPLGIVGSDIMFNEESIKRHNSYHKPSAKNANELVVINKFSNKIVALSEFPGMESSVFINMAKSGVKGFVLRSHGSGVPNVGKESAEFENLRPAFEYLQQNKIPLVLTSQAPDGVACMNIYEPSFIARELGAIPTHDMTIEAAVAKLSWLLGQDKSYDQIHKMFPKSLRGEIH